MSVLSVDARAEDKPATAPPASKVPIGVSNIVLKLASQDELGLAGAKLRVQLIERLRENGYAGVGAESLVFDKDETHKAKFLVGGTVNELVCARSERGLSCRLGVEWELLDVERDRVVYTVQSRAAVLDLHPSDPTVSARLLIGAFDSMLSRPTFRAALQTTAPAPTDSPVFASAKFAACPTVEGKMPESAERVLRATVLVKTETGFGSGVFLSSDGLVMTAAHVLKGSTAKLRLKDGAEIEAVAIRVSPRVDIALMRPTRPITGQGCLAIGREPQVGTDVYVAGAPADQQLAFSLARGIVSGTREMRGSRQIQTDAAVSPGNSGGPLIDGTGALVAIVTSKLAGGRVEGVAFSVPMKEALEAVSISPGSTTDSALVTLTPATPDAAPRYERVVDPPDPVPSLDPEGERRHAAAAAASADQAARIADQKRRTPAAVSTLYGVGVGSLIVGGGLVLATGLSYDANDTRKSEWRTLVIGNTIGWAGIVGGATALVASRWMTPPLAPPTVTGRVVVGPARVGVEGSF